jgi:hypothetical protein
VFSTIGLTVWVLAVQRTYAAVTIETASPCDPSVTRTWIDGPQGDGALVELKGHPGEQPGGIPVWLDYFSTAFNLIPPNSAEIYFVQADPGASPVKMPRLTMLPGQSETAFNQRRATLSIPAYLLTKAAVAPVALEFRLNGQVTDRVSVTFGKSEVRSVQPRGKLPTSPRPGGQVQINKSASSKPHEFQVKFDGCIPAQMSAFAQRPGPGWNRIVPFTARLVAYLPGKGGELTLSIPAAELAKRGPDGKLPSLLKIRAVPNSGVFDFPIWQVE